MSSWKALLLRIGEKCPEYGGIDDFKDHIESCYGAVRRELDHPGDDIMLYLIQCAEQLPHKIPLYGTLVGLLNLEDEQFVSKVVEKTHSGLQAALISGDCNKIRILMRFLTVLMCCKVLQPSSLFGVFETLLASSATTSEARGDFYVRCIMSCLPWGGPELLEQVPEDVDRIMVGLEAYFSTRRHVSDTGLSVFEDFDGNDNAVEEKVSLEDLWSRTQELSNAGWKLESVPRPHLSFEAQLVAGKSHDFGSINCPEQSKPSSVPSGISYGRQRHEEVKAVSFRDLGVNEQLSEACDNLGWKEPTKIQIESIPHALEGKDVIALAQTGSGKTGAFALPILQALLEAPQPFFACVLSPTRELAIQISEQFEALGSGIGVKCAVLVGGVSQTDQSIALAKRPHIVVATPGRLVDHLSNTKGFSLRLLKYLVLDEADRLLNEDFEKTLDEILNVIPQERRTYLFSATMTKKVKKLQRACLKNPVKIEAASKYSTVDTLKQQYRFIPAKYKECYLVYILTEMSGKSTMVFTRTCDATGFLALMLRNLGLRAIPISGQMTQSKRLGALNKFKAGECHILVCTDVASRGLDIPSVDMVVNYDIPSNSKDYIHRVGRTARAGRSGVAISLVNQYEVEWYIPIEKLIGKKLPQFPAEEEEVLLYLEQVMEAKRLSIMKLKEGGGRKKRRGVGDDAEEEMDRFLEKSNSKGRNGMNNGGKGKKLKR